jgi:bifunctional DNA-binding transcriptional regulator/antitoxin component of YhaV-PrlF toxin-antitoxin module
MEAGMIQPITVQVAQRGVIVLPKALRQEYEIRPGDRLTLLDLGGVFVLSRRPSEADALAERISGALAAEGQTLEGMLQILREERERYAPGDPDVR